MDLLVVDDDDIVGRALVKLANLAGLHATFSRMGGEALAALECAPAHTVALVDTGRRDGEGIRFIEALRSTDATRPVVFMTGKGLGGFHDVLLALDVAIVLAKPFGAEVLKAAVEMAQMRSA